MKSALSLFLAALLAACQASEAPFARSHKVGTLDEAVGGPTAGARAGDFILENDQIRAVIAQGDTSWVPTDVGGALIDLDLQRPQKEFRGGHGLDQLGEIAPMVNLNVAHADKPPNVRLTRTQRGAEVTVSADAQPTFRILLALVLLIQRRFASPPSQTNMYTEYEVRPGERLLRVRTTVGLNVPFCKPQDGDGCNAECDDILYDHDCQCAVPARCRADAEHIDATPLPDRQPASLLAILLGDLPQPLVTCADNSTCDTAAGETCVPVTDPIGGNLSVCRGPDARDAGLAMGDLLIFGAQLTPFIRGDGYDTETATRRLFDTGKDTLSQPLDVDGIFATGDRVSLGYYSPTGHMLVPIFRGPFSLGTSHSATCKTREQGCLEGKLITWERWISVGEGDVASAQEPLLKAAGAETGVVQGRVISTPDGAPRTGINVFAMHDPVDLACDAECQECPGAFLLPDSVTFDDVLNANRCRTHDALHPDGTHAIESFAKTDVGTDPLKDGNFRMALPPGVYWLFAVDKTGIRSPPVRRTVTAGATVDLPLALPQPAVLSYSLIDEATGRPSPGKITVGRLPGAACAADGDCPGQECLAGRCTDAWGALLPLDLGGTRPDDGIIWSEVTATGAGTISLPPGDYDVELTRGPHYSMDRQRVKLTARVTTKVVGGVKKVVDRKGWISAGLHVHAQNSVDAPTSLAGRVLSFVAEDMDYLSSSDHDYLTPYDPIIRALGLTDLIGTQVGVEITTQEYGHYLAYPLRPQMWKEGERLPGNDTVQWRGLPPQEIIDEARKLGDSGPPIIHVPHPYDYFDFYLLDPVTLEPTNSLLAFINPILNPSQFTGDFDVMELANTKNFHRLRRPTVSEIAFYGSGLDALIADLEARRITSDEFARQWLDLSMETERRRLHRTVAEQDAELAGVGADVACLCGGPGDCGAGQDCDAATMTCVPAGGAPTDPPPPDAMCVKSRGVLDDWFNMLNRGIFRTGVGGADEHDPEAGFLRTMLQTGGTTPPFVKQDSVVEALRAGRAEVTNGPMIHFVVGAAGIGQTTSASAGAPVQLSVRVEKAPWYDVDRLEIYRNGRLVHWANGCDGGRGASDEDQDTLPCLTEGNVVLAWDQVIEDHPDADSWYAVVVYGLDGRSLAPVYTSQVLAEINTTEITRALFQVIPGLQPLRYPRNPTIFPNFPFAVTNPIWVDVGGDGWTPPLPPPSWCRPGDIGCPNP